MRDYDYVDADLFKEEALIRRKADIYRFLNESGYLIGRFNKSKDEYFRASNKENNTIISIIKTNDYGRICNPIFSHKSDNINDYVTRVMLNNYGIDAINTSVKELSEMISAIKEFPKQKENSVFIPLVFNEHICVFRPRYTDEPLVLIYADKIRKIKVYENMVKSKTDYSNLLVKHIADYNGVVSIEEFVENQKKMYGKTYINYRTANSTE